MKVLKLSKWLETTNRFIPYNLPGLIYVQTPVQRFTDPPVAADNVDFFHGGFQITFNNYPSRWHSPSKILYASWGFFDLIIDNNVTLNRQNNFNPQLRKNHPEAFSEFWSIEKLIQRGWSQNQIHILRSPDLEIFGYSFFEKSYVEACENNNIIISQVVFQKLLSENITIDI